MNDEDRIAYLSGDHDLPLPDDERAELDELRSLLEDPSLWSDPSADLEDRVVAAVAAATAGRATRAMPERAAPPSAPLPRPGHRARATRLIAAAAALVLALGVIAGLVARRSPGGEHFSMALAAPAGALQPVTGAAELRRTPSGWRVELDAPGLPRLDGGRFYEAWLRNGTGVLVPIGTFNEGRNVVLWAGVSPRDFPTLTITREDADGDQASSGVRVLVGTIDLAR
jgi:hypothetical protein